LEEYQQDSTLKIVISYHAASNPLREQPLMQQAPQSS